MINKLNVFLRVPCSDKLGPFNRYILWTQGCDKNCKGCMSQEARRMDVEKYIDVDELVKEVIEAKKHYNIEGITVSGGEALLQIPALTLFLKRVQALDLGVILYTGFTLDHVLDMKGGKEILNYIDLIIDGPYIEELNDDSSALRGSTNQRLIYLSDRYKDVPDYNQDRKVEIKMDENGLLLIGVPKKEELEKIKRIMKHFS